ncbi:ABC transporter substrate-binding protein [Arthrobacter sp. GCM10027362]|uniref:ABC transporter substrate-binding protein n=1 Tax=Arthrobacter sp. GCM10027362 TaxID=3273379 RepID=UPI00362C7562
MENRQPAYLAPANSTPSRRHRSVRAALAGSASLLALLLAGCGAGGGASVEAAGSGAQSGEKVQGGTVRYAHLQEPPCIYGGWVQQAFLSRQVLDSLVSQTDDGKIVPWLAKSWSVSEDQKTWTFKLKAGVKFTDGTPVNAQAIADNFDYWAAGGNGTVQAHIGEYYKSAQAVDDTTVRIHLKAPFTPFLSAVSQGYFGIQSPAALKKRTDQQNCEAPIGSGPFTVGRWKRGESVTFLKNPGYNSAPENARHQGPAYVDSVVWSFVQDNTSRFGSLASGESDAIGEVPTVDFEAAKSQYEVQQYITPGRPVTLSLNTVQGPFTDRLVRQAFAYSADRKAAVDSAFLGVVPFEGNGTVSQSTPGYDKDVADDYPFDQAKANELLDKAGWTKRNADGVRVKDGKELEINLVFGLNSIVTTEGATALQNLQEQVKPVGFKVNLHPVTQADLFAGTYSTPDKYDAQLGYWTSPHSGILYINFRQNTKEKPNYANTTFYNNAQIEKTILKANSARTADEANKYYAQAQQALSDEAVAVGLYTQTSSLAVQRKLKDVWLEASQGEPVFHDAYFTK